MLKCESTTPLGSPVLPLLKMIVAVSLTVTGRGAPAARSSQRTGAAMASAAATARSAARMPASTSST